MNGQLALLVGMIGVVGLVAVFARYGTAVLILCSISAVAGSIALYNTWQRGSIAEVNQV